MNLRDLKYLVALVDLGHFGNAAKACHVSQPALSMQLKKLEESLGVQLIERSNKSFLVTSIGKRIAEQARDILQRVDTMQESASLAKDPLSGKLNIGIIPTLAPYLLPHIMPGLTQSFQKLSIYLVEEQTTKLIANLKEGKLDAAMIALPLVEEDFSALPLFEEEFMLAVHAHHSFAKLKSIKQESLENKTLLLLDDGHCMRDQALSLCHRVNASEVKSFQATSLETLRYMVASNIGITLMPKLSCRVSDDICYLPFSAAKPVRTIGLVWRSASARSGVLEAVVAQIRKLMAAQKLVKVINTPIFCRKK